MPSYPWYSIVEGDSLEQGDLLRRCTVFFPPPGTVTRSQTPEDPTAEFEWAERDLVVISQTCDLVKARERVTDVLLCAVWPCDEVGGHLATPRGKEDARRGNLPAYHMLAPCTLPGLEAEVAVVDFRRVYSLPVDYLREFASEAGERLRLLPQPSSRPSG